MPDTSDIRTLLAVCTKAPHFYFVKARNPFCYGEMESPNTSLQAIDLELSCSRQACSNRPGTGPGYENTEPGFIFKVFRVPSIIHPLRSSYPDSRKVV